jgi:hypothetical protein
VHVANNSVSLPLEVPTRLGAEEWHAYAATGPAGLDLSLPGLCRGTATLSLQQFFVDVEALND